MVWKFVNIIKSPFIIYSISLHFKSFQCEQTKGNKETKKKTENQSKVYHTHQFTSFIIRWFWFQLALTLVIERIFNSFLYSWPRIQSGPKWQNFGNWDTERNTISVLFTLHLTTVTLCRVNYKVLESISTILWNDVYYNTNFLMLFYYQNPSTHRSVTGVLHLNKFYPSTFSNPQETYQKCAMKDFTF